MALGDGEHEIAVGDSVRLFTVTAGGGAVVPGSSGQLALSLEQHGAQPRLLDPDVLSTRGLPARGHVWIAGGSVRSGNPATRFASRPPVLVRRGGTATLVGEWRGEVAPVTTRDRPPWLNRV